MGYISIENLYKEKYILMFKKAWALEKIHGTSSWVTYKDGNIVYHAGWPPYKSEFRALFDHDKLLSLMKEIFGPKVVKLHGEFYGRDIMAMGKVYGEDLGFILFDISVDGMWLSFKNVIDVGQKLGLDIVDGVIIDTNPEEIERVTNLPSVLAKKHGMGEQTREGVVLRPIEEFRRNNGSRVIAKNKTEKYQETTTPRSITEDPAKLKLVEDANEIARDWVTFVRLDHVIGKLQLSNPTRKDTKLVIEGMIADIQKEGIGEVVMTPEASRAIARNTSDIFSKYLTEKAGGKA